MVTAHHVIILRYHIAVQHIATFHTAAITIATTTAVATTAVPLKVPYPHPVLRALVSVRATIQGDVSMVVVVVVVVAVAMY